MLIGKIFRFSNRFNGYFRSISTSSTAVGFIGIGNMGSKMAQNLLKKGEVLVIYDTQPLLLEPFKNNKNVTVASSVKEVAQKTSRIITMLPNNESVWSVYTDENGIIRNCDQTETDVVFIDCSTIDPSIPQQISAILDQEKFSFLDAPVSGGVVGAEAGTLTFMVGGNESTAKRSKPLLLKMGSNVAYCGLSGMGQAAKLCNNFLLSITMAALAETMNIGIKFGLDAKLLTSIINSSSGRCWSSDVYNPVPGVLSNVPSSRNYEGGFKTTLLLKDLKLALDLAEKTKTSAELGNKAFEMYNNIAKSGSGGKDFSIVYEMLSKNYKN